MSGVVPSARAARAFALLSSAVALFVYVRTLAPGLVAITDTPKFQFIGRILGTAHNPGYPLYVVVSHVFGYLPFGSLAWRINLMSAIFAAAAVGLSTLTLVAAGCAPPIAAAAALALAFGSAFWMTATIAEVYSLHLFLVAGTAYLLIRWRETNRPALFFGAIAVFAVGLGHHTTIVLIAPAMAAFALVTAPRFVTRIRTMGLAALILLAGLSQYLFIIVRTRQGAWGESPARTLADLVNVVRGAQFAGALRPFGVETWTEQSPGILRLIAGEVSPAACVLAALGFGVLAARDRALAAFTGLALAGVAAFGVSYSVPDIALFMLPAYLFLWLLAAVALDAAARLLFQYRRFAVALGSVVLLALAGMQYARNVEARDMSHDRTVMRHFASVFRALPERSAILGEDFLVDRMIYYKTLGEDAVHGRDILAPVAGGPERARGLAAQGYQVFAFDKTARVMREAGLEFDYAAWPLAYGPLRQFLTDQRAGSVVAIAVPAMHVRTAIARGAVPLDVIGGRPLDPYWANVTVIGVVGRTGAIQWQRSEAVVASATHGQLIGETGTIAPADIFAHATYDTATIHIGARELIRSGDGPVVAVWDARGGLRHAFAPDAEGHVPIAPGPLSLRKLRTLREWTPVDHGSPAEVTDAARSGHIMVDATRSRGSLVIYAGRDRPLDPRLLEAGLDTPPLNVREFAGPSPELAAALETDGWPANQHLQQLPYVYRVAVPADDRVVHIGFGGLPRAAFARTTTSGTVARIYGLDLSGQLEPIDGSTLRLHVARDHHEFFLGSGWSPVAADHAGAFRATTAAAAELTIPCGPGDCLTTALQLRPVGSPGMVTLVVNGVEVGQQTMAPEWNRYQWSVPPSVLREGMNSFILVPSTPVLFGDALLSNAETKER